MRVPDARRSGDRARGGIEVSGVAGAFTWTGIAALAGAIAAALLIRSPHLGKDDTR
ncbi:MULTISPECIES: hypothetical protein [Frankia]|uniref:hypothetical protein n=1 Tax=Frankia TaxID=1854 RepID=UPI000306BC1F|nr:MULTISPECIES: hypothetical protein [Frankia]